MAKKQANNAYADDLLKRIAEKPRPFGSPDLGAELKKRVRFIKAELEVLNIDLKDCVNERAHLKQYYNGLATRAEAELAYIMGLLEG